MSMSKRLWLSVSAVASLSLLPLLAWAAIGLSSEFRTASQFNEWFVRGDATVTPSSVFPQGVRLNAWDGRNPNDVTRVGLAAAVYFFQVPAEAQAFTVRVYYKADPNAQDHQIAGFVFVRDRAVEQRYAPSAKPGGNPVDNPEFYGDTYILPSNKESISATFPAADRVSEGVLELHVSANAGQVLDVQGLTVAALAEPMAQAVTEVPSTGYISNPYNYGYNYYYMGPWLYPYGAYSAEFYPFDYTLNPFYWDDWWSFRSCFSGFHSWCFFPAFFDADDFGHFRDRDRDHDHDWFLSRSGRMHDRWVGDFHRNWLEKHFGVDSARATNAQISEMARNRQTVLSGDAARAFHENSKAITEHVQQADLQLRSQFGNQFGLRARDWAKNPGSAHQQFQQFDKGSAIHNLSNHWLANSGVSAMPLSGHNQGARGSSEHGILGWFGGVLGGKSNSAGTNSSQHFNNSTLQHNSNTGPQKHSAIWWQGNTRSGLSSDTWRHQPGFQTFGKSGTMGSNTYTYHPSNSNVWRGPTNYVAPHYTYHPAPQSLGSSRSWQSWSSGSYSHPQSYNFSGGGGGGGWAHSGGGGGGHHR